MMFASNPADKLEASSLEPGELWEHCSTGAVDFFCGWSSNKTTQFQFPVKFISILLQANRALLGAPFHVGSGKL